MKYLHNIVAISGILALVLQFSGCQDGASTNNPPPEKVKLVAKSADGSFIERGIDAENREGIQNQPNGIFIEWDLLDEDDISRYRVYRRQGNNVNDSTGTYQRIADVFLSSGESSYLDTTAAIKTHYFYYVTAIDEQDQEGQPSRIDRYYLLEKALLVQPASNQSFGGQFNFLLPNLGSQFFTLRLERRVSGTDYQTLYVKLLELREGDVRPEQIWTLNDLEIPALAAGQYRWRIDLRNFNDNRQGSESDWGPFFQQ